jgi:3D (Asp-Asp-Asp) domain-containing protein
MSDPRGWILALLATSCGAASEEVWGGDLSKSGRSHAADGSWRSAEPRASARPEVVDATVPRDRAAPSAQLCDDGRPCQGPEAPPGEVFRNTYYDFPRDGAGAPDATLFDAACAPIARVTQRFHDQVCVQGSGRLTNGETVSFARRDCACAAVCPRTSQRICFERLDSARFPHGRGAAGRAITPFRTVAVDTAVIPLGTPMFVPEYLGVPRPDGSLHDGCFVAEDRGLKVVGRQIDVFTGDPRHTAQWNALVPSNRGVHVRANDPRCASR